MINIIKSIVFVSLFLLLVCFLFFKFSKNSNKPTYIKEVNLVTFYKDGVIVEPDSIINPFDDDSDHIGSVSIKTPKNHIEIIVNCDQYAHIDLNKIDSVYDLVGTDSPFKKYNKFMIVNHLELAVSKKNFMVMATFAGDGFILSGLVLSKELYLLKAIQDVYLKPPSRPEYPSSML